MFQRRILHHGPSPLGTPVILEDRAVSGCWFELLRQGGCGSGELVLQREFQERDAIQIGDWISCEKAPGERWYLGRVEETRYQHPGRLRLRLAGMVIELNEVFPGGFDAAPVERRPVRYGDTDLFSNDPDRDWEVAHPTPSVEALVRQLIQQHVVGQTHVNYLPTLVESPRVPVKALSFKYRGEESIRSILKDLALRAQADWGVDAFGRFFFRRRRTQPQATYRINRDLISVEQVRDRELIFNRLLLTGDYIYDQRDNSGQIARRVYRWRANFFEPGSCRQYGNRRLRLWVPWIRTQADSLDFAREFFRLYAQPAGRYLIESLPQSSLLIPWDGSVTIEDATGTSITTGIIEKVRILFDHAPRFRMEIGPEDPREQWPEPPQDERWEIPDHIPSHGGDVSMTSFGSSGGGGGGGDSTDDPFRTSSSIDSSSDLSSNLSSSANSWDSSAGSDDSTTETAGESSLGTDVDSTSSLLDSSLGSDLSSDGSASTQSLNSSFASSQDGSSSVNSDSLSGTTNSSLSSLSSRIDESMSSSAMTSNFSSGLTSSVNDGQSSSGGMTSTVAESSASNSDSSGQSLNTVSSSTDSLFHSDSNLFSSSVGFPSGTTLSDTDGLSLNSHPDSDSHGAGHSTGQTVFWTSLSTFESWLSSDDGSSGFL